MLTSIRLSNFKCFEQMELEPRRITVLIGPNGTGKSSVFQALMLLRQSVGANQLSSRGSFVNVELEEVVFGKSWERTLGIGFGGCRQVGDKTAVFRYEMASTKDGVIVRNYGEVQWDKLELVGSWVEGQGRGSPEQHLGPIRFTVSALSPVGRPFSVGLPDIDRGSPRFKEAKEAEVVIRELERIFSDVMISWRFIPSLRGFARSTYQLWPQGLSEIEPIRSHDDLSAGIASTLAYEKKETEEKVSEWVKRVTGVPIEHKLVPGPQVGIRSTSLLLQQDVSIVNEGFGTNQLTFLMFQLAKTLPDGLAAIEEPEIHLHPHAIASLGDLFVELATTERKQLLLATHSDHLLLGLLNNVAEKRLAAEDLAIYYFEQKEGRVSVMPLKVTPEGMVKGGLPGFLDATLEAQRRHLNALSKE